MTKKIVDTLTITPDSKWWDMELKRTEALKESLELIEDLLEYGHQRGEEAISKNYEWMGDTVKKLKEVLE